MNVNDDIIYRFNPNVDIANAYENITNILGISSPRAIYYSWYDKAIHYGIESGDTYYRYSCEQRIKMTQQNGDLFVIDGADYDVLVLPKKGSSVSVRGGNVTPSRWYVFGASSGVYGEWASGQITEPDSAYATARMTDTLPGLGIINFKWNEFEGKNINLGSYLSSKIVVKQKGLYKMNYRVNASGNNGDKAFVWFIVNNQQYQQTNTRFTIANGGDYESFFGEIMVQLNIGDVLSLSFDGTGSTGVVSFPANSSQPATPGVIFNIQLINPTREPFI
jgi:hypothetical protein